MNPTTNAQSLQTTGLNNQAQRDAPQLEDTLTPARKVQRTESKAENSSAIVLSQDPTTTVFASATPFNQQASQFDGPVPNTTSSVSKIQRTQIDLETAEGRSYPQNQSQFKTASLNSIAEVKTGLSQSRFRNFYDILKLIGDQRQAAQGAGSAEKGFGALRGNRPSIILTRLDTSSYQSRFDQLKLEHARRIEADDEDIKLVTLNSFTKNKHLIEKHLILNDVEYECHQQEFTYPALGTLELSTLHIAKGDGVLIREVNDLDIIANYANIFQELENLESSESEENVEKKIEEFANQHTRKSFQEHIGYLIQPPQPTYGDIAHVAEYVFIDFQNALKADKKDEALKSASDLVFLMANMGPYSRGSAWGSEVLASALVQAVYDDIDIDFLQTDLDFAAFGLNSEEFHEEIKKFIAPPQPAVTDTPMQALLSSIFDFKI